MKFDMLKNKNVIFLIAIAIVVFIYTTNQELLFPILLFGGGIVILAKSADKFMNEAPGLIYKLGLPSIFIFVIGLALATSLPEILVTSISAYKGITDQAVGNIVGSNMLNLIILAIVAIIGGGLAYKKDTNSALIAGLIAAGLLWFSLSQGFSAITTALILLAAFGAYIFWVYKTGTAAKRASGGDGTATLMAFLGIAGGAYLVVYAAEQIGNILGWSGSVVGLILLAFATNVPEMMVLVMSAIKKQLALGAGAVVGSNIINITFGLGVASLFAPLAIDNKMLMSILVLIGLSSVAYITHKSGKKLTRNEAAFMIIAYAAFIWWSFT